MKFLKKTIDALMFNKMNIFHWHVSDSETFPLLLNSYPDMCKWSRYNSKDYYTIADFKEIF